jgi:hypothetical protein
MSQFKPIIIIPERQCSYCGSYFKTNKIARLVVCEECKALRSAEQQRRYRARRRYNSRNCHHHHIGFRIIHDPDIVYGYSVGATFPKEEVHLMMTVDCHAFTLGTIIADPDDHHFIIIPRQDGGLRKVPCPKEQTPIKN